jgi:hypothetical protein
MGDTNLCNSCGGYCGGASGGASGSGACANDTAVNRLVAKETANEAAINRLVIFVLLVLLVLLVLPVSIFQFLLFGSRNFTLRGRGSARLGSSLILVWNPTGYSCSPQ